MGTVSSLWSIDHVAGCFMNYRSCCRILVTCRSCCQVGDVWSAWSIRRSCCRMEAVRSVWYIDHVAGWEPDDLCVDLAHVFPALALHDTYRTPTYVNGGWGGVGLSTSWSAWSVWKDSALSVQCVQTFLFLFIRGSRCLGEALNKYPCLFFGT